MGGPVTGLHFYGQKNQILVSLKEGKLLSIDLPKREQTTIAQSKLKSGMVGSFGESIYWVLDSKLHEVKSNIPVLMDGNKSNNWRWNETGKAFPDGSRGSFQLWKDFFELSESGVIKNAVPTGDSCKDCYQLYRWSAGGWLSRKENKIVFFEGKKNREILKVSSNISHFAVVYSREIKDILLIVAEGNILRAFRSQDGKI